MGPIYIAAENPSGMKTGQEGIPSVRSQTTNEKRRCMEIYKEYHSITWYCLQGLLCVGPSATRPSILILLGNYTDCQLPTCCHRTTTPPFTFPETTLMTTMVLALQYPAALLMVSAATRTKLRGHQRHRQPLNILPWQFCPFYFLDLNKLADLGLHMRRKKIHINIKFNTTSFIRPPPLD